MASEPFDGESSLSDSSLWSGHPLDCAIDRLIDNDRQIAALMAHRAVLLDSARELSESAQPDSSGPARPRGWNTHVIARRELISSVACALRLPERTAENLIENSRILVHDLQATHVALATGSINYRQAETIVDHATSIPAASSAELKARGEFESTLLAIAPTLTAAQLDGRAGRIRERMHPESIVTRHKTALDRRCVDLTPGRDGMAWLNAHLPAAAATAAYSRITELALHVEGPGETSTLAQLRADVFADLLVDGITYDLLDEPTSTVPEALNGSEHLGDASSRASGRETGRPVRSIRSGIGRGIRATVHVTVPVLTLLGADDAPAEIEGYGPIDPDTARKLAAGAPSFHRILTHPETGVVLSVGRDSYTVPADLRRWLILRDETCRFPGCSRSARRIDIDHSLDWQYDGATVHDNLAHLCPSHHHLKHQTAWSYTQRPDGKLEWTSPFGHRYATEPAVHFRNDTVDPEWVEHNRAALDALRAIATRHSTLSPAGVLANAERFSTYHAEPPENEREDSYDRDDPYDFDIHEAS